MTIRKTYVVRMTGYGTVMQYVKAKGTSVANAMHNAAQEHYPYKAYDAERLSTFKRHKSELLPLIEPVLPPISEHLFVSSKAFPLLSTKKCT